MAAAGRDSNSAGLKPGYRLVDRGHSPHCSATLDDGVVVPASREKTVTGGRPQRKKRPATGSARLPVQLQISGVFGEACDTAGPVLSC